MSLEVPVVLERHGQHIKSLQQQVDDLKTLQGELKCMNETLIVVTSELKNTNDHLARHEEELEKIRDQPRQRLNQIITAIISALAGGIITAALGSILLNA